ncbi:MAG: double-stranded DNA-binding protein [Thaumarchaeota archaeon]|nr:double-stranded DNA-binding protein [Nitrososphaerota archaeon]MBT5843220.1 double-stranded DNA-binding protein [Nitrososphaerota archaeon]MBT6469248.1 double-stranded DNA-binding protein [Nitrososphaerota archaeon]
MSDDSELERLKAKRLEEMQKNISSQKEPEPSPDTKKVSENPRDKLIKKLGFRGLEVLENAEFQFPNETKMIIQKLFELIKTGELNETVDGGQLLSIFRSVGLNIRMETKINVEQDGKFVSLSDKLGTKPSDSGD